MGREAKLRAAGLAAAAEREQAAQEARLLCCVLVPTGTVWVADAYGIYHHTARFERYPQIREGHFWLVPEEHLLVPTPGRAVFPIPISFTRRKVDPAAMTEPPAALPLVRRYTTPRQIELAFHLGQRPSLAEMQAAARR